MPRSSIINLGIFAILIIVIWLGIWPGFQEMRTLQSAINDVEEEIIEERLTMQELQNLADLVSSKKEELDKLETAIPSTRDVASIIAILEEAANTSGLALTSIEIVDSESQSSRSSQSQAERRQSILEFFIVKSTLTGKYASFRSFLKEIESTFPLMDTSEILLQPPVGQDSATADLTDPVFSLTLTFETYYTSD